MVCLSESQLGLQFRDVISARRYSLLTFSCLLIFKNNLSHDQLITEDAMAKVIDSLTILFALSWTVFTVSTVKIAPEMNTFIVTLLKQCLREVNSGEIFEPRIVYPAVRNSNSVKRLMLPDLLWNPLVQFPDIFNGFVCPYCALEDNHGFLRTTTIGTM